MLLRNGGLHTTGRRRLARPSERSIQPTKKEVDLGQMLTAKRRPRSPHRRVPNGATPAHHLFTRRNTPEALRLVVEQRQIDIEQIVRRVDLSFDV